MVGGDVWLQGLFSPPGVEALMGIWLDLAQLHCLGWMVLVTCGWECEEIYCGWPWKFWSSSQFLEDSRGAHLLGDGFWMSWWEGIDLGVMMRLWAFWILCSFVFFFFWWFPIWSCLISWLLIEFINLLLIYVRSVNPFGLGDRFIPLERAV